LRHQLTRAISEDAAAFDKLMAVFRDKELDEADKAKAIEQATVDAAEVPLQVARLSREVASMAHKIVRVGNANAVTDAAAAAIMALAAVQVAALNVKVNVAGLKDQEVAQSLKLSIDACDVETSEMVATVTALAAARGGFSV
jgi:formiminotetrahydrofolate cyclodeaminase